MCEHEAYCKNCMLEGVCNYKTCCGDLLYEALNMKKKKEAGGMIPFPNKKYQIIYADPPWSYDSKTLSGTKKGNPTDHYQTMSIEDICKLPIHRIADENCILFLWATYPKIKEALKVIESWGFTYKSIGFQWIKLNKKGIGKFFGLGRWTRGNTEPCFIATKGKPKRINAGISQLIESPIREHSRKPEEARGKIIELIGDVPRIELFARQKVDGWDYWGNEV